MAAEQQKLTYKDNSGRTLSRDNVATSLQNGRAPRKGTSPSSLQVLDLEIMAIINKQPTTGYDLKKLLLEIFELRVSFGTLYPHLKKLSDTGLLTGNWLPSMGGRRMTAARKVFSLSPLGKKTLLENVAKLEKTIVAIQHLSK